MPESFANFSSFTGGEFSPRLFGRRDIDKYRSALKEQRNFVTQKHGGIIRRSGSRFVAEVKDSSKATRLIDFVFSVDETYQLEFGDQYVRFYRDRGRLQHGPIYTVTNATWAAGTSTVTIGNHQLVVGDQISVQGILTDDATFPRGFNGTFTVTAVTPTTASYAQATQPPGTYSSGGTVVNTSGTIATEIATPWTEAQLPLVKVTQSFDVLYVFHPSHEPRLIKRNPGADSDPAIWTIEEFNAKDGPYLRVNINTAAELTIPAGAIGTTVTVTADADAVAEINNGQGFVATDVGRVLRWQDDAAPNNWRWGTITVFNSRTSVDVLLGTATTGAPTVTDIWRLGMWSDTDGWPFCGVFHEDRLWMGGTPTYKAQLFSSNIDDFQNMQPSLGNGDVLDIHSLNLAINDDQQNTIHWVKGHDQGVLAMTNGGLFIGESTEDSTITPLNFRVRRVVSENVSRLAEPQQVSGVTLVPSGSGRRVWELVFRGEQGEYQAPDMTLLAEHITLTSLVDTALQTEPDNLLWCVRTDGVLVSMTYERLEDVVAWHRHYIGGSYLGSDPVVESVSVTRDGNDDLVWIIVKRTIDGSTKRYVEFMEPLFPDDSRSEDGIFVDSVLSLDAPVAITSISVGEQIAVSAPNHGFPNGARVRIRDVVGTTEVNDRTFIVGLIDANQFILRDLETQLIVDGTSYGAYVTGGTIRLEVNEISGLSHLAGETVRILVDGKTHPDEIVSAGGLVNLDVYASIIHVGLAYLSRAITMPIEADTHETRHTLKRIDHGNLRVNRTCGGRIGDLKIDEIITRIPSDPMGQPTPLFTGILRAPISQRHGNMPTITVQTDDPLPMNLLSLSLDMADANV